MAAVDFGQRPVAGLAGCIELLHEPRAGQVLELAADLEHVDADSVEYRGTAHADGTLVLRLKDCVGPMVQLAKFDSPQKLRMQFEALCRTGVVAGGGRPARTEPGADGRQCWAMGVSDLPSPLRGPFVR